jgi:CrcB protein
LQEIGLIGFGGAIGSCVRYLLGVYIQTRFQREAPVGTWIINISGSFALGCLAHFAQSGQLPAWLWNLVAVGFLGAYTTFSTFGYETVALLTQKKTGQAITYVGTSIIVGILFAWLGLWI